VHQASRAASFSFVVGTSLCLCSSDMSTILGLLYIYHISYSGVIAIPKHE
jgi:hypothetical protein